MILLAAVLTLLAPNGKLLESSVAVSGSRAVVAVINTSFPGEIDVFVSADGALTWSAPMAMPMTVAGKTYRNAFDPTLAVLDDGSFALAYLVSSNEPIPRNDLGDMGLVFVRSADGVTWSEPQLLASGHALFTPLQDKPWLTVDRPRRTAYLVWTRTDLTTFGQEIVVARSTDRGATWSAPVAATPKGSESFGQLGVLADGTMVLTDSDGQHDTYVARVSHDGGATFGDAQVIAADVGPSRPTPSTNTPSPRMQMLAAWRNDLYCAYPATNGVFFTASHDGGTTWSQPLQLGGAAGDALLPSVAVEEATGNVAVAWLDGRDDPNHATLRLYAARSTDGGKSFSAPTPFSAPFAGGAALGDYNHIASFNSGVYLTTFASAGGYLTAARIDFPPTVRRRAANH